MSIKVGDKFKLDENAKGTFAQLAVLRDTSPGTLYEVVHVYAPGDEDEYRTVNHPGVGFYDDVGDLAQLRTNDNPPIIWQEKDNG